MMLIRMLCFTEMLLVVPVLTALRQSADKSRQSPLAKGEAGAKNFTIK